MSSLKLNLFYNIAYQILQVVLPLITAPYISRVLGVDGIGTYSYIYSIAYYFGLFGMLGISNLGNRSIALNGGNREKISNTFWNLYCLQALFSFLAIVAYIIFSVFIFNGNRTIALIDVLFLLSYATDISWLYFGLEQFKVTVTRNAIVKVLTALFTFLLVKNSSDLWLYTFIMGCGALFNQLYLWIKVHHYIDFVKPNWLQMKVNIKPLFILFIPVIAYSIYKVMDKIMLGAMTSVTQVGIYENADRIVNIPVGIITAFGTVMLPRISTLLGENNERTARRYNRLSFRYFTMIACAAMFGLIGVSDVLAPVYFGEEFTACAPVIAGLSITLLFMTWSNIIRTQYLIPHKKDKPYVISTIAGAIINLFFNSIFIPQFGAIGALIGTILAEATVLAVQTLYVHSEFPVIAYLKSGIPFFIIGIIMCIVVKAIKISLNVSISTLIIQIVCGAALYCICCLVYFILIKDEILYKMLNRIRNK